MLIRYIRFLFALVIATLSLGISRDVTAAPNDHFPATIALPNGWQPEGIARGYGTTVYSGSTATGAIYQADLRTGKGSTLIPPMTFGMAVGMQFDPRTHLLYVAGGFTGKIYVHDTVTATTVATITATTDPNTFVNDVVVTREAVYFTDSSRPYFYRLPLETFGRLPASPVAAEVPLSGDYELVPGAFNANGIVALPGGRKLIIVNSALGTLYLVDSTTGTANAIDLDGGDVLNGDGLMLNGRELYVVQNYNNQVTVVEFEHCFGSGRIVDELTDSRFDFPTTLVDFGPWLYVINSRLSTPPTPDMQYSILQISKVN
jgi:sugar lactone lactonase YvrE